ncbi:ABC transporter permease subunit [Halorientalis marina]|uniref:ABC transporter permease subunit n=1 Tax=Halorientalis marina TaxID=2931976 RepID=UPI001FF261DE|nr:ABC transporter permease subunit [Halorientalis marina]
MTWRAVARKDFADAVRSRSLWTVAGIFVVASVAAALVYALVTLRTRASPDSIVRLAGLLHLIAGVLVPVTALLTGYRAIVGERESGSIKLLLSLPHERRNVVIGKLVGRSLVVAVAIAAGFGIATLVAAVFSPASLPIFLGFTAVTVLFAVAFVAIAVGLSAASGSARRAATGAFGAFVLFDLVWQRIPGLYTAAAGARPPAWVYFLQRLSPNGAYSGVFTLFEGTESLRATLGGSVPVYLSWWVAALILVAWIVLPTWVGYRRFAAADL